MRKTKILATLGPSTNDVEILKNMIRQGLNAARINFSHGTYDSHREMIEKLKMAREAAGEPIPLMLDTKGPEIRVKTFKEGAVKLEQGDSFTLTTRDIDGDKDGVSVTYADLPKDVKMGGKILLDDGLIELKVERLTDTDIICTVVNGGTLKDRKGVNVPDVYVNLPAITQKDEEDILFGIEMGIDYVAASFIRSGEDIIKIRRFLEKNGGSRIKIIAKIENREGVDNIDEILKASDGIMVARGDLGVEINLEEVPIVQKELIAKANRHGKTVITATQMLESMITNPRPTRAEANDVANAIFDGTDTIMLSGETASGKYPCEAIATMARIAVTAEDAIDYNRVISNHRYGNQKASITDAISYATCTTAADIQAPCIVTVTNSGFTARMVSKFRPLCPILAVTESETTYRQMSLIWGCKPLYLKDVLSSPDFYGEAVRCASESGIAVSGDNIVIVAGVPIGVAGTTNSIRVQTVGDVLLKGAISVDRDFSGRTCVVKGMGVNPADFRDGDILVTERTDNSLMPLMRKASAIIVGADGGGDYEHALTTGQALDIPVVTCTENVVDRIPDGVVITIDSLKGIIYNGVREL